MSYNLSKTWIVILILATIWELYWKARAMWVASQNNDLNWFVALLLINTVGVLPILYLLSRQQNNGQRKG